MTMFRLTARGLIERPALEPLPLAGSDCSHAKIGRRPIFVEAKKGMSEADIYDFQQARPRQCGGGAGRDPHADHHDCAASKPARLDGRLSQCIGRLRNLSFGARATRIGMDPVTFSIIRHRLFRVVEEAVITLKHVSGSAITNEGHDLMVSLYQADGSLLMGGVGFLHHLTSAAEACKAIIRSFPAASVKATCSFLNDPYTAALHTSDIYLVAPIHHGGKLVAWSACFVHVSDIGAMNPGRLRSRSAGHIHRGLFLARHQVHRSRRVETGRVGHDPQHGPQPRNGRARSALHDRVQ